MIRKDTDLCRIWDDVVDRNYTKGDDWRIRTTLRKYNKEHKNDPADRHDLLSALDKRSDI